MGYLDKIKHWLISEEIEHRLFLLTMMFAIPYFLMSISFDLIKNEPTIYFIIDCSFLIVTITMLGLSRIKNLRSLLIMIFCALITTGFVFFWNISGGVRGGAPYIFFVLTSLLILMNTGRFRDFYTLVSVILVFVLTSDLFEITGQNSYEGLLFDFILNLVILAFLLVIFKMALDKEQNDLEIQNEQLLEVTRKLNQKTKELEDYNSQIESIKNNLENIVEERTAKLEQENKKNIEYAFINAHLVRAPIANMLAVIQLTEKQSSDIKALEANIYSLDNTLRDIAKVLSD